MNYHTLLLSRVISGHKHGQVPHVELTRVNYISLKIQGDKRFRTIAQNMISLILPDLKNKDWGGNHVPWQIQLTQIKRALLLNRNVQLQSAKQ